MPEGVKWRGKSVYQVLTRLADVHRANAALYQMQMAVKDRTERLEREAKQILIGFEVKELAGINAVDLDFGGHTCDASPTDYCIYNGAEDHWHDHCLFCGEPSDRG